MSVKAVVLLLLVIVALALVSGPGFRRLLSKLLGLSRRGR